MLFIFSHFSCFSLSVMSDHSEFSSQCPTYTLYAQAPCTPEKDLLGHRPLTNPRAYDTFLTVGWPHYRTTFTCPKLDLAVKCLWHFECRYALREIWYYVTVPERVLTVYYEYVMQDHRIRLLPFWCWCHNSKYEDDEDEEDDDPEPLRHMIAIYPLDFCLKKSHPSYFKDFLIDSKRQLLRCLFHVSSREENFMFFSCCKHHFYVNLSLPIWAKYILSSLCKGGLQDTLFATMKEQLFNPRAAFSLFSTIEDQTYLPVKSLLNVPKNLVLPVQKHMRPSKTPAPFCFYFVHDQQLSFTEDKTLLDMDEETWSRLQAQLGNCFFDKILLEKRLRIEAYNLSYSMMLEFMVPFQEQCLLLEQKLNALENRTPNADGSNPPITCYEQEPYAPEKDLLGHPDVSAVHAYDSFLEPLWPYYHTTFSCPKLDRAAKSLWHFESRDALKEKWYHVTVSEAAFDLYYEHVMQDPHIRLLPFWSWCNGGSTEEPHRHMIAVYSMESTWLKMMECTYFEHKEIESKRHLVGTILQVSGEGDESPLATCRKDNLFYINMALPSCAKFILSCLWHGGLQELLYAMMKNQLTDPCGAISLFSQIQYFQILPVKALKHVPKGLVLPVPKQMKPSTTPTPFVFHLINKHQLYFTKDNTLLDMDEETWLRCQIQGGNRVLDNECLHIENYDITYHTLLKFVKCFQEHNHRLENKVKELETGRKSGETEMEVK